jgi:tRNA-dihydrouridine synthase
LIARAVDCVSCPVLANGDITSAAKAERVLAQTKAAGVMVGRSAIRNPWIFRQIRACLAGSPVAPVPLREVRGYIDRLWTTTAMPGIPEAARVGRMKKFLNFVGQSVDPDGAFIAEMRHALDAAALFAVCDRHLLRDDARCLAGEPFPGVIARPNCENPDATEPRDAGR